MTWEELIDKWEKYYDECDNYIRFEHLDTLRDNKSWFDFQEDGTLYNAISEQICGDWEAWTVESAIHLSYDEMDTMLIILDRRGK